MVYNGPADQALGFFDGLGYKCEDHNNPPDFFRDVINEDSSAVKKRKSDSGITHSSKVADSSSHVDVSVESSAEKIEKQFKDSQICTRESEKVDAIWKEFQASGKEKLDENGLASSFCQQFRWVSKRTLTNIFRNPETYVMQICVVIVFALLVGLIYLRLDKTIIDGIPNRAGAFFFIVMNQIFQNLSSVDIFIKERTLFIHENSAGFYGCFAYFLSKVVCDLLPMRMQPVLFFAAISYFMNCSLLLTLSCNYNTYLLITGLDPDVGKFFFFTLTLFLATVAACSVGFFVSACVNAFAIANLAIALAFVFMMVYSGMLVKLSTVGWWFKWMKYISIFRYSLNALSINEMKNMAFCTDINGTEFCDPDAGNKFLEGQEIEYGTTWDLWVNQVALVSLSLGLLILAYIVLRCVNKKT